MRMWSSEGQERVGRGGMKMGLKTCHVSSLRYESFDCINNNLPTGYVYVCQCQQQAQTMPDMSFGP